MEPHSKIDFAKIRQLLTIEELLSHYNVKVKRVSNTEMKCHCPLESHKAASKESQNEDVFKFGIDKKSGVEKFFCHDTNCRNASNLPKGGDVIDLQRFLGNEKSNLEAAKRLVEWFPYLNGGSAGGNGNNPSPSAAAPSPEPPRPPALPNPPLSYSLECNPVHPFIQEKGLTVETCVHFGVGYHESKNQQRPGIMNRRIIFPLYENSSLVGYCGNDIDPKCAKMCAINFWLFGFDGVVTLGDALAMSYEREWRIAKGFIWERDIPKQERSKFGQQELFAA